MSKLTTSEREANRTASHHSLFLAGGATLVEGLAAAAGFIDREVGLVILAALFCLTVYKFRQAIKAD